MKLAIMKVGVVAKVSFCIQKSHKIFFISLSMNVICTYAIQCNVWRTRYKKRNISFLNQWALGAWTQNLNNKRKKIPSMLNVYLLFFLLFAFHFNRKIEFNAITICNRETIFILWSKYYEITSDAIIFIS